MGNVRENLINSGLGRYLVDRYFEMPAKATPQGLATAIKSALGQRGSVGAARVGALGELEPAADASGCGWGVSPWDVLAQAPITTDAAGLCVAYADAQGLSWRWTIDFTTNRVAQAPQCFNLEVNR